ncbi:MAG: glycosyltransferase family 9 protein, partial [Nitrososphaerota archaeon]
ARVIVASTRSLIDLAVILRHAALALSNDTGPGHLAGALGIPTVTPYLPGALYSRQVWASTLWHTGVTVDPSPYSFEDLKAAVFTSRTDIINTIPPEPLAAAAIRHLQERI